MIIFHQISESMFPSSKLGPCEGNCWQCTGNLKPGADKTCRGTCCAWVDEARTSGHASFISDKWNAEPALPFWQSNQTPPVPHNVPTIVFQSGEKLGRFGKDDTRT